MEKLAGYQQSKARSRHCFILIKVFETIYSFISWVLKSAFHKQTNHMELLKPLCFFYHPQNVLIVWCTQTIDKNAQIICLTSESLRPLAFESLFSVIS